MPSANLGEEMIAAEALKCLGTGKLDFASSIFSPSQMPQKLTCPRLGSDPVHRRFELPDWRSHRHRAAAAAQQETYEHLPSHAQTTLALAGAGVL